MPKDIKVKEKDTHSIRKLDRRIAFTSRVKRNLIEQHKKLQEQEDQTTDNVSATNYATGKVIRGSDRGTRESAYLITDISKTTYKKVKMKLAENKSKKDNTEKEQEEIANTYNSSSNNTTGNNIKGKEHLKTSSKQERINKIKTRILSETEVNNAPATQKYQIEKLVKEKQNYKNIKQHSIKDAGIKENNNLLKIKTRDKIKNNSSLKTIETPNIFTPSYLMRKSKVQELKQNTGKIKEITKKTGKVIVDIGKKIVKRTKRNRNVSSFWRWICCTYYYDNCFNGRNVWICLWIFIFK